MVNDEATSSSKNESTTSVDNCGNQQTEANFNRPLRWFKLGEIIWFFNEVRKWYLTRTWTSLDDGLVCGTASTAGFIYGLRVAWIHSKLKPGELPRTNLLSGAGLAMQAFGLASLITISGDFYKFFLILMIFGYISFVVLISEVMGVNTLKEFGTKTKLMFGDRFRISKGKDETYESLSDLFEKFQK
uniref:Uncharacterized protein n=1 Tax=Meloidogyne javanica TaxID=6303 RepID=A0A915LP48_MELJA